MRSALARGEEAKCIVDDSVPRAIEAVQAEWYKLIEEGLRLCVAVAELVRPIDADMAEGEGMDVASKLLEAARPRLVAGAVDLEIRERAIECVGDVTARFADVMDADLLKGAVSDLVEQLDRVVLHHALAQRAVAAAARRGLRLAVRRRRASGACARRVSHR